jgi:phosphoribosylformylglycinamidine synthase subunit PurQ / glutaminase
MRPKTLVLRAAGTNCDVETAHAFGLAGSDATRVHVNRLIESPSMLGDYQLLAIAGGFSYGDDISAGKILATQIMHHLRDALQTFIDAKKPIIGICNGFQVLVKTDLLPGPIAEKTGQTTTLAANSSGRFDAEWVKLTTKKSNCIWTADLPGEFELPIAHGEGRFVCGDESIRKALWDGGHVALTYADASHDNGSVDRIAGICDTTGLVFGLMPHPERYVDPLQHYAWTSRKNLPSEGDGLAIFRAAVKHAAA